MKKFEREPGRLYVEFDEASKRSTSVGIIKPFVDGGLQRSAKIFCTPLEVKQLLQIITEMMSDQDFRKAVQKQQSKSIQTKY